MNGQDLQGLNREIRDLKSKLNDLESKKEHSFKEYNRIKEDLSTKISKSKKIHGDSKKTNIVVSDLKKRRDEHNANVRKLIAEVKTLNSKKVEIFKKYGIKKDISEVKKEVQKLQEKLETEALSFDAEKKLMKQINSLEKSYKGEVKELLDKTEEISKNIDLEKKKADEFHKKMVEASKTSKFEGFISLSKEIVELKKIQKKTFDEFVKFKNSFQNISEILKNKLIQATKVKHLFDKKQRDRKKSQEEKKTKEKAELDAKTKNIIDKKQKIVEEKLKKGEKLTTEDLLAMQGND
tara:strand:+ start:84 stop:965 length:882 start_codon:yes stop_codon:yes gene_type:complete